MRKWAAAILITLGLTLSETGDVSEPLWAVGLICLAKLAMIFCGGALVISADEEKTWKAN